MARSLVGLKLPDGSLLGLELHLMARSLVGLELPDGSIFSRAGAT